MKKLIFLCAFSLLFLSSFPQQGTMNFDDPATLYRIDIDTTLPGNLWQIGTPQKSLFNAPYSPPNVIVTDTVNPYPANNTSVFYYRTGGDYNADIHYADLNFWYKMDCDTLTDYGIVEISYDYGNTWENVLTGTLANNPYWEVHDSLGHFIKSFYYGGDTLVFTGTTNGWYNLWFEYYLDNSISYDSIIFRFTFHSGATVSPHDGWMIDDIGFFMFWESIPEAGTGSSVFPNPATDRLTINPEMKATSWQISDMTGSVVLQGVNNESLVNIDVSGLKKGFYIYRLRFENGSERAGKFLKE